MEINIYYNLILQYFKNVKYLPWNIVNKVNNSYMTRKQQWKTNSAMLIVH